MCSLCMPLHTLVPVCWVSNWIGVVLDVRAVGMFGSASNHFTCNCHKQLIFKECGHFSLVTFLEPSNFDKMIGLSLSLSACACACACAFNAHGNQVYLSIHPLWFYKECMSWLYKRTVALLPLNKHVLLDLHITEDRR